MSWPISAQELHVEVEAEVVLVVLGVVDIGLVMVEGPEGLDRGRGVARVDGPGSPPAPPSAAAPLIQVVLVELLLLALLLVKVALLVLDVQGADERAGTGICLPLIQVCAVDTACQIS